MGMFVGHAGPGTFWLLAGVWHLANTAANHAANRGGGGGGGSGGYTRLAARAAAPSRVRGDCRPAVAGRRHPARLPHPGPAPLPLASAPLGDSQEVNGNRLVYFDNAATSQKPAVVIQALADYFESYNANVHRGVHTLRHAPTGRATCAMATDSYERARQKVAAFVNAPSDRDIVFTRNASEAINLVAYSWGQSTLAPGDEILLSVAEHHSNIVPWQLAAQKTGAVLKYVKLTADEQLDMEHFLSLLSDRTKMVALHHASNTLGSINPMEDIIAAAHGVGARVLVDACQSVPHMPVDVQELDVDFLVASAHKMCGPTGIGFLFAKHELLQAMPPFLGGGEMISEVLLDHSTYAEPPSKFEAGTPAIAEAIALGAAIDYLNSIGMDRIHTYEGELALYLYKKLSQVPGVRIYGPPPGPQGTDRVSLCSFNVDGVHATDLSTFLDQQHGVAVRSGHHCTQPLHRYLGINASARASLYFYNTIAEVDTFIEALNDTVDFFRHPFEPPSDDIHAAI
eukprot:SM000270S10377  [mRNA]  locus=s270:85463:88329:- [translate_table: standard]